MFVPAPTSRSLPRFEKEVAVDSANETLIPSGAVGHAHAAVKGQLRPAGANGSLPPGHGDDGRRAETPAKGATNQQLVRVKPSEIKV